MTKRMFALTVPGAVAREYDFYNDYANQIRGIGRVHPADLYREHGNLLRTLSAEFDEFRGLADAGTSYAADGYEEIPDGAEEDPTGFAYTVVYLHPQDDRMWGDDIVCLRAVIDPEGGVQDLRYGYSIHGDWAFVNLAEG